MILLSIQGLILLAASVQGAHGWKVCAINDPAYSRSCNKEDCTAGVRAAIKDCFGGGTVLVSNLFFKSKLADAAVEILSTPSGVQRLPSSIVSVAVLHVQNLADSRCICFI